MPSASESSRDSDELPDDLGSVTPAYGRALWIVVLLNLGYACVEIVASIADYRHHPSALFPSLETN